jgi:hypothetical protein
VADAALNRRHLACSHFHPAECYYSKDFRIRSQIEGVKFFPGLPNGTEVGQECDQRLGAFKASCYQTPKKLLNARIKHGADNAEDSLIMILATFSLVVFAF